VSAEQEADWLPTPAEGNKGEDWQKRVIRNRKGDPKTLLANVIIALRHAPEWRGVLAYDEFALAVKTKNSPVFGGASGEEWDDHKDRLTADWLQHAGIGVSVEVAGQGIQAVARDNSFHPVREYLDALKWDGTGRIDDWLCLYLGVDSSDYARAIGARYLRSAVARVMQPGCKADCCLILEGDQGIKKSTALKVLGQPWFTDEIADLGSKDAALQTRGVWLIEIAELDSMTRAEIGKVKAFMSRAVDRFRPPYGRHLIESPRQCVFAGSVNHGAYLRDETGGRRFWPCACTRILIDELTRDRNQLWAEACASYRAGAAWWLDTQELTRQAEGEQGERYEESAWDGLILDWAAERLKGGYDSVSVSEVLDLCIHKKCSEWGRSDEMRVAAALRRASWKRCKERTSEGVRWRWKPTVPTS
jgi:predicted P-loop ATPase